MSLHELERILIGEIMLAQGGHRCLQSLCALGTRFPGTAGEELAQQYIMQKLQSYGLQPHLEEFEHLGWQRVSSRLELVTPVAQELLAVSLAGAPSTPEGGLEGEILFVGNGTPCDFDRYQDQIKGRIVLVSSLSPQGECSPPRQCHRRTKYGRAVAYGAAALLFMNSQPGMLPQVGSTRQNMEGEIPAVSIPYEEGQLLQYHLARGPVRVRLQTVNRSFPHKTGNPHQQAATTTSDFLNLVQGKLYRFVPGADGTGYEIVDELAAGMPTQVDDEGTVWRVKVRDGLVWSNGEPLTADDILYSWKMCMDPLLLNHRADAFHGSQVQVVNALEYVTADVQWEDVGINILIPFPCYRPFPNQTPTLTREEKGLPMTRRNTIIAASPHSILKLPPSITSIARRANIADMYSRINRTNKRRAHCGLASS